MIGLILITLGLASAVPGPSRTALAASCAVTNAADTGPGTLREKVADPACDSLTFSLDGSGPWTIALTSDLPTIARPLTITGPGANQLTIDRQDRNTFATRAFPL